jgi:nucleoside-diphosphate-sugar epimerase
MIIGNGLIAGAFKSYFDTDSDFIVFASGVSNSNETNLIEFKRERLLLQNIIAKNKFLIYFSTCSIYDNEIGNLPYVQHKKNMEILVSESKKFMIFRLPQVIGRTKNKNTLANYIYYNIINGHRFNVWKRAQRNIIDVEDVASIVNYLIRRADFQNSIINVACPFSIPAATLVNIFEDVTGVAAKFDLIDYGAAYSIDTAIVSEVSLKLGIIFDNNYIKKLVRKYYSK